MIKNKLLISSKISPPKKGTIMKRSFIREILESIDEETISFAGGLPDETLFPLEDLKQANAKVYENAKNLQYTTSNGIVTLREKIADFYNEDGFQTQADNILITTGSQQALYIIAKYFEKRDIVIEKPSYLGAVNIFNMNSLDMKPIMLHDDGIDIEAFKDAYKRTKLAYLIPDFQNPKASLYSDAKRRKVAKTILKSGGYIIEDAPYSELYFEKKSKSISSQIPENSLHLGSFSKTLSPSLRLGWVRANTEIIKELVKIKETIDLHSCSIVQHTLINYLQESQRYKCHLQNIRDSYKNKMNFFAQALQKHLPAFHFSKPKGGMFIYGRIEGIDSYELVQKCMKEKVVFVPANQFYLEDNISNEIRFNFTHTNEEEVEKGLKIIYNILHNFCYSYNKGRT